MAPRGDKSDAAEEEAAVAQVEKRPISTILIIIGTQYSFLYILIYLCVYNIYICVFFPIFSGVLVVAHGFIWELVLGLTAMQTEALPVVNKFQLTEDPHPA